MITSQEINAMIAMQGQGVGYSGMPVAGPVPGASQYPPQFSYAAPVMTGGAIGQAAAGGLMNSFGPAAGGLSSAAMNVSMAAGIGGWAAGKLGYGGASSALGAIGGSRILGGLSNLNPMNAAFTGAFAAGEATVAAGGFGSLLTGAGLRGLATGAVGGVLSSPAALIGLAAAPLAMGMHRGAQQYSQTAGMLGAYNQFANPFAATGRGFSDTQMSGMVSQMRAFQAESPFISMRDMQQSMARFNEMGMNQGERDAQEFSKKFTQMAKTVTAMSKAMGTTMDEASKVFAQMRSVGFYTGADVAGNTLRTMTLRGEGISGATTLAAQAAGGGITRAGGLGTTPGAKAVGGVMSMFTGARGVGALSNEEMMNITGAATPEQAIAQLSTSVTGSLTNFYTGTGVGQAMLAALGATDKSGAFTGGLDAEMVEKLRSGQLNINNLVGAGRSKVSTRNAALSFKTKGQDVAGALLSQGDPTAAIGAIMQSVAGDKFQDMDPENLITLLTERIQGLSRKEAEAMTKLYREGEKIRRESQQQMRAEMQAEIFMTDVKERHSFEGFKRRFMGGISDSFAPLNEFGQQVSVGLGGLVQRTEDNIFGVTRVGSTSDLRRKSLQALINPDVGGVNIGTESGFRDQEFNERVSRGAVTPEDFKTSGSYEDLAPYEEYLRSSAGLSAENVGAAIRRGQNVEEYILGQAVAAPIMIRDRMGTSSGSRQTSVRDIIEMGGEDAEGMRNIIGRIAAERGATEAVKATAYLGKAGTGRQSLKEQEDRILEVIASAGGSLTKTDMQDYEALLTGGGLSVVSAIGGKMGAKEFKTLVDEARGSGKNVQDVLKEKQITGLSEKDIDAFLTWAESSDELGLSKEDLQIIAEGAGASQKIMDYSNLAAMTRASADVAQEKSAVGSSELDRLARTAGTGRAGKTAEAVEELLDTLEKEGKTAGSIGEEYGALSGSIGRALAQRNVVRSGDAKATEKILKDIGYEDADIAALDLTDTEKMAELVGRANIQGDAISGGGAFTDTTQAEAIKYYRELAGSVAEVTSQVMVMQERERAYQATRGAAPLPPNAAPGEQ